MFLLTPERLDTYMREDRIGALLAETSDAGDDTFVSQRWLLESPGKRLMYDTIYGDLLFGSPGRRRVLDVGGGFCGATRRLLELHDYTLLEINAHDNAEALWRIAASLDRDFWRDGDWYGTDPGGPWDVVIANDLFPNVDQRLTMFLERILPVASEVRLSLTYHNAPRFYMTRRLEGEEVLCMLAFDGARTRDALLPFRERIVDGELSILEGADDTVFPNKRQVCIIRVRGSLA